MFVQFLLDQRMFATFKYTWDQIETPLERLNHNLMDDDCHYGMMPFNGSSYANSDQMASEG